MGCLWCTNEPQGSFFFSACHFRGIRDDIEEEDEQVSEPSKVFNPLLCWSERSTLSNVIKPHVFPFFDQVAYRINIFKCISFLFLNC